MKRIKQIFGILLILGLLILPSGCGESESNNNSQFNPETDMQYFYHKEASNAPITKSESGYYYVGDDGIIIYVDKESMSATPLCFEPNCLHDDPEKCKAYFNISKLTNANYAAGSVSTVIQYYKDKLYMVCEEYDQSDIELKTYLMRCDKDGSNRERITDYFDKNFMQWLIHRGYFYYTDDKSVLRVPIDSPKSKPETVYTLESYEENSLNSFEHMLAYGNYLYFYANEKTGKVNMYQVSLNLNTLEATKLIYDNMSIPLKGIYNNKIMLIKSNFETDECVYYGVSQDLSSSSEIYKTTNDDLNTLLCDGKYFFSDNRDKKYIGDTENFEQLITVYDLNFNKVDSFKLPQKKGDVFNYFTAQDNDYFLLDTIKDDGERMLVIADKSQIGSINGKTIEYKELCKLNWCKNKSNPYITYEE